MIPGKNKVIPFQKIQKLRFKKAAVRLVAGDFVKDLPQIAGGSNWGITDVECLNTHSDYRDYRVTFYLVVTPFPHVPLLCRFHYTAWKSLEVSNVIVKRVYDNKSYDFNISATMTYGGLMTKTRSLWKVNRASK